MTIPTLMINVSESEYISGAKKAYSTLFNAYNLAVLDNGTPDKWSLISYASGGGASNIINTMAPYLKIAKKCDNNPGCSPDDWYKQLDGADWNDDRSFYSTAIMNDGSTIQAFVYDENCALDWGGPGLNAMWSTICGEVAYDVNGIKRPNRYGKDVFTFLITKTGILAVDSFTSYCYKSGGTLFPNGWGCTAWVIQNGNVDYLHCSDLSWTGKRTCK
ncbi:hypothetical protein SDC9_166025 [bioreactor metagenome]|uniref:Uncharacterized protein n=1 Tax=bioreactor metagenome TaxID=1076179 RepID=A0A645FY82_9ZZZZ